MSTLSLPIVLKPCGTQGELYAPITIGTTQLQALIDTGSSALLTVQNVGHMTTYKRRPQVATLTLPNIPLGLNCSLQCTDQPNSACFFSQDKTCELHFGTGDLNYVPVLEAIQLGSMKHPAFFLALADTEENFPFPIPCIMGVAHYKYSDDSPLGSLCAKGKHGVLINQTTVMFQLFQHLGGGNCLVDTQTLRLAYDNRDHSVSFAVPLPADPIPRVPMITSMLPFYAVSLTGFQVGAVTKQFSSPQIVILDSGTSSGGSLAPEVYDFLASVLVRYTNGLSGLSINDAQVQGVPKDKLGLFPPIAFTWGPFKHVIEPSTYMVADDCKSGTSLVNAFSRGSDNISVVGNVVFQHLAITFDLLHDQVYFEHLSGPVDIDKNYPSPAAPSGKGVAQTMAASLQAGESVVLSAPKVRSGIPKTVIQKMAAAPINIDVFGSALVNNQCCLFSEKTQQKKEVGSFAGDKSITQTQGGLNTGPWSTRNIVLLTLVGALLALGLWALTKYAVLVKKQKSSVLKT